MSTRHLTLVKSATTRAARAPRRIFFLDIENYAAKDVLTPQDVEEVRSSIARQFAPTTNDLIVVGTSHSNNFLCSAFTWQGPRFVLRRGHDGADRALLAALDEYRLGTFDEVLILSGDGIFADKAAELGRRGLNVTVVSKFHSLSRRLLWAAPCMAAA